MLKSRVLPFLLVTLLFAFPGFAQETITGRVFHDLNKNGKPDQGEPGIPGIMVSN